MDAIVNSRLFDLCISEPVFLIQECWDGHDGHDGRDSYESSAIQHENYWRQVVLGNSACSVDVSISYDCDLGRDFQVDLLLLISDRLSTDMP